MNQWVHRIPVLALLVCLPIALPTAGHAAELETEHECMALALYWEARGEDDEGMTAVGWTILNRVDSPDFPATPCGVVYEGGEQPPCQFSWWCDGKSDRPRDDHHWMRARIIASSLLTSPSADPTGGALFFHAAAYTVHWAATRTHTVTIGNHHFYR